MSRRFLRVMVHLPVIRILRLRFASAISTAGLVGFRFLLGLGISPPPPGPGHPSGGPRAGPRVWQSPHHGSISPVHPGHGALWQLGSDPEAPGPGRAGSSIVTSKVARAGKIGWYSAATRIYSMIMITPLPRGAGRGLPIPVPLPLVGSASKFPHGVTLSGIMAVSESAIAVSVVRTRRPLWHVDTSESELPPRRLVLLVLASIVRGRVACRHRGTSP